MGCCDYPRPPSTWDCTPPLDKCVRMREKGRWKEDFVWVCEGAKLFYKKNIFWEYKRIKLSFWNTLFVKLSIFLEKNIIFIEFFIPKNFFSKKTSSPIHTKPPHTMPVLWGEQWPQMRERHTLMMRGLCWWLLWGIPKISVLKNFLSHSLKAATHLRPSSSFSLLPLSLFFSPSSPPSQNLSCSLSNTYHLFSHSYTHSHFHLCVL